MSVYSLDIHLITNNTTIINAVSAAVPAKLDARMWADEYTLGTGTNEDGDNFINIMVRFNEDAERTTVWNWMKSKRDQVVGQLLTGSFIRLHTCYHDETPVKGCVETNLWSK